MTTNTQTGGAHVRPLDRRLSDQRFDILEKKIDKISDAMFTLVRVEERGEHQARVIEKLEKKVDVLYEQKEELKETVHAVRASETQSTDRSMIFERIIWIIVSVALGSLGLFKNAPPI